MPTSCCPRPRSGSGTTSTRRGAGRATTPSSCVRPSSPCTSAATTWTSARTWPGGWACTATSGRMTSSGCARSARAPTSTTSTPSASTGWHACPPPKRRWPSREKSATPPGIPSRRRQERSRSTRPRSPPTPTRTGSAAFPPSRPGFRPTRATLAIPSS